MEFVKIAQVQLGEQELEELVPPDNAAPGLELAPPMNAVPLPDTAV